MKTLLDITQISEIICKTPATIRNDLKRRPHSIPPKLNLPGKLRWHVEDVDKWIEQHRPKKSGRPRGILV